MYKAWKFNPIYKHIGLIKVSDFRIVLELVKMERNCWNVMGNPTQNHLQCQKICIHASADRLWQSPFLQICIAIVLLAMKIMITSILKTTLQNYLLQQYKNFPLTQGTSKWSRVLSIRPMLRKISILTPTILYLSRLLN